MTPYQYVHNNPIMFTDPTGMSAEGAGDPPKKERSNWASKVWTEVKSWFGGKTITVTVGPLEEDDANPFVKFLSDFTGGSQAMQTHSEAKDLSTRSDGSINWAGYAAYTLMQEKMQNPGGLEF